MKILAINSGSSSLKASFFKGEGHRLDLLYTDLSDLPSYERAILQLLEQLQGERPERIAHRITHGGDLAEAAKLLTPDEIKRLEQFISLAPLHQPANLLGVKLCSTHFQVPQIACYDTAFHHTLAPWSQRLPLPSQYGLRRYGFHGLSYSYIAQQLPSLVPKQAEGRVLIAHLGSGASCCLLSQGRSVDTSMAMTPASGLVMATRSGDLDPALLLHLAKNHKLSELEQLLWKESGLRALSEGIGAGMKELLASSCESAHFAVEYFCRRVAREIAAMASCEDGLDAVVFTGGIGENSAAVRSSICQRLSFLQIRLDPSANSSHAIHLEAEGSLPVLCLRTDEQQRMADLCRQIDLAGV